MSVAGIVGRSVAVRKVAVTVGASVGSILSVDSAWGTEVLVGGGAHDASTKIAATIQDKMSSLRFAEDNLPRNDMSDSASFVHHRSNFGFKFIRLSFEVPQFVKHPPAE